jgi:hypothetical protein
LFHGVLLVPIWWLLQNPDYQDRGLGRRTGDLDAANGRAVVKLFPCTHIIADCRRD